MQPDFEYDITSCLKVLQQGGLILYPTDTIWGIGCDPTHASAVERIYKLKQRNDSKSMIILVADEREVLRYVASPDPTVFDYLSQCARPTTVIYDGAIGLAENMISNDGSIAVRICRDNFCRHLIKRFRKPLVSTSANISGQPTARVFAAIPDEIKKGVDYIVQYRQNDKKPGEASSIIKWGKNGRVEIIR